MNYPYTASIILLLSSINIVAAQQFGVDVSFPIHYNFIGADDLAKTNAVFGDERVETYKKYMQGCINRYGGDDTESECMWNDEERLRLNLNQPQAQTNYTDIGFKKTKLSDETWSLLNAFWADVKAKEENFPDSLKGEEWPAANTYVNHWERDTQIHPLDNSLRKVSLSKDPDRHVDQEVAEPWPLEVIGHDGLAHNITINPGEVVLYESHSVIHGRPYALRGKNSYFANVFVHFKPYFDEDSDDNDETVREDVGSDSSSDDDSWSSDDDDDDTRDEL
ncbi:hypothetical protein ACHAWC_001919 [Mediolabrus comicus]